jgi:polyferredoxin
MATLLSTRPSSEAQNPTTLLAGEMPAGKGRRKLLHRAPPDSSQKIRRTYQRVFLLVNIWLGGQFYLWVRHYETSGQSAYVPRPAGVEGWLPIAGLMNFKYWLLTGRVPEIHPAAMFVLLSIAAISFLFRKSFCSWLCPIGTFSEYLWRLGRSLFRRNFTLPRWIDIPLRGLKYLLLGFFVWAVGSMSPAAIAEFMRSPYGVIADVKMLNFFRYLGSTAAIVLTGLALASIFVQNFWCRYLCPYGALLGLTSLPSPLRIRRNEDACIDCAKCARACPAQLPVDRLITIKSAECTGCLECVASCPAEGALQMALPGFARPRRPARVAPWAMAAGIAALFLGVVGFAKVEGYWKTAVTPGVYRQLVPQANEAEHPMSNASAGQ